MNAAPSPLSQLRWRCRRGLKELDVLLARWLEQGYGSVSSAEQAAFHRLLELPEPELAGYLLGNELPADARLRAVVAAILGVPAPAA